MVELGPLGPTDPATGRHPNTPATELLNYWARGTGSEKLRKPAVERCYIYAQEPRSAAEWLFRRPQRTRHYVVRVIEDHAGRCRAHTERYDPERGSASRTGHGSPVRVELTPLTHAITLPMTIFAVALFAIIMVAVPFPLNSIIGVYWSFSLFYRLHAVVERARFARQLARQARQSLEAPQAPPLLSPEELDARVFKLANPDEDHTFDEPPPIPMATALRDPAWKRWTDRLPELPDQEYRVGRTAYAIKQNNGFADGPDHPLYKLVDDVRTRAAFCGEYSRVDGYVVDPETGIQRAIMSTVAREEHESLRPLFVSLGREVLGPERAAQLEDARRAAAHGEPMLDRRFAARTDCAEGHIGHHPILSTFTDSTGRKRVRRGCPWCPSVWSELA